MNNKSKDLTEIWSALRGLIREQFTFSTIKELTGASGLPVYRLAHLQQRSLPARSASKSELLDAIDGLLSEEEDVDRTVRFFIKEIVRKDESLQEKINEIIQKFGWSLQDGNLEQMEIHNNKTTKHSKSNSSRKANDIQNRYDVFICHASEDKKTFVKQLAEELRDKKGLKVWYDEFELKLGDSLRECIDKGLASSRYGVVVLSHAFFSKNWPKQELNALYNKFTSTGQKVILPVWHDITPEDVIKHSPLLADRVAVKSTDGVDSVVDRIFEVISGDKDKLQEVSKGNKPEISSRHHLILESLGRFVKKEWKWIIGIIIAMVGLIIAFNTSQITIRPHLTIIPRRPYHTEKGILIMPYIVENTGRASAAYKKSHRVFRVDKKSGQKELIKDWYKESEYTDILSPRQLSAIHLDNMGKYFIKEENLRKEYFLIELKVDYENTENSDNRIFLSSREVGVSAKTYIEGDKNEFFNPFLPPKYEGFKDIDKR